MEFKNILHVSIVKKVIFPDVGNLWVLTVAARLPSNGRESVLQSAHPETVPSERQLKGLPAPGVSGGFEGLRPGTYQTWKTQPICQRGNGVSLALHVVYRRIWATYGECVLAMAASKGRSLDSILWEKRRSDCQ